MSDLVLTGERVQELYLQNKKLTETLLKLLTALEERKGEPRATSQDEPTMYIIKKSFGEKELSVAPSNPAPKPVEKVVPLGTPLGTFPPLSPFLLAVYFTLISRMCVCVLDAKALQHIVADDSIDFSDLSDFVICGK